MSAPSSDRLRVLTVGAYERDNFGDLLFLLVTEKYLPGAEIVAAAPFAADMTELLDREVGAFGDLLREESFDAVWSVGGQIGGTNMEAAFRMSMAPEVNVEFKAAPYARQRQLLATAIHDAPLVSPYLPTPAAFPLNAGAVSVVNSAGLAGVRARPWHIRKELLEVLRTTDAVSVRDAESSAYLAAEGIEHTLVPDVVHALGVIDPFDRDPDADNVVIQASDAILRRIGHHELARTIVESRNLDGLKIRLLLAGTATGHDSVEHMSRVADEIRRLAPSRDIEIVADRRPMDLVDHIRRARVVIGSSLHVRIVSAAYHVPRLTFTRVKPAAYAAHWDPAMPFNVELPELDRAVGIALDLGSREETVAASAELTRLAHDNVARIAGQVLAAKDRPAEQVAARAAERTASYQPILAERLACEPLEHRLRGELDEARRELRTVRSELNATRRELDDVRAATLRRRARRIAGRVKRRIQNS